MLGKYGWNFKRIFDHHSRSNGRDISVLKQLFKPNQKVYSYGKGNKYVTVIWYYCTHKPSRLG